MKALDLFCGAGGASAGLVRAGFSVTGVDICPQPHYPFDFIQADALSVSLVGYDLIWASPPCQAYTPLNAYNHKVYPDLIAQVRNRLLKQGTPFIIENVPQAPLRNPVMLCGQMFLLRVYRHRCFESSISLKAPSHQPHEKRCVRNGYLPTHACPYMTITGGKHSKAWIYAAAHCIDAPWMRTVREVCEAIPPIYAYFLAKQLATCFVKIL